MPPDAPSDSPLKQIRTYQGDVAEALEHQHESLISIRQKELARKSLLGDQGVDPAVRGRRIILTIGLIILSLVLLGAGGYAAWISYHAYLERTAVPPAAPVPANELVPAIRTVSLDITTLSKSDIISTIESEKGKPLAPRAIEQINFVQSAASGAGPAPTAEFLDLLASHAGSALVRAFDPLFMLGLVGSNTSTPGTFLLIKLDAFPNAFAGMLAWEPSLASDLLPLFADASTSEAALSATSTPVFTDATFKNKDARVLYDANGKELMLYSFFNQNTLIVTDNESDLEALTTLLAQKVLSP